MTMPFVRFPANLFLLIVLALVIFAAVNIVANVNVGIVYGEHAVIRHGSEAEIARQCLRDRGAMLSMVNPATHRRAQVCGLPDGSYAVVITEGQREVTSFIKNKMKRLEQVVQYLQNAGYVQ